MNFKINLHKSVFSPLKTVAMFLLAFFVFSSLVLAQNFDSVQRGQYKDMLNTIKAEIKKSYYDPNFQGIDLDARFKVAAEKLENATSLGQANSIVAQVLLDFNDSHTRFYPPATNVRVEYGWQMYMIGDKCFVTAVKPGSDAEKKGLKIGDEILAVNNFRPNRKEFWKMQYYYNALNLQRGMLLTIQSPDAKEPRQLEIAAKVVQKKRVIDLESSVDLSDLIRESESGGEYHRFRKVGNVMIWQMPSFGLAPQDIDSIMRDRVNLSTALILDLRGNGGGRVDALERFVGYFFDKDLKIADVKGRKESKPSLAKTQGAKGFGRKVIVLVDSRSASAAEAFARVMQLEKRGVVLGDQSSGKVMQSRGYPKQLSSGMSGKIFYFASITNADVVMTDGKSLENFGVTPDEKIIPSASDLAAGRDPVLARALELAGVKVSPEDAGKFFPFEWDN